MAKPEHIGGGRFNVFRERKTNWFLVIAFWFCALLIVGALVG